MKCLIIGSGGREHALAWKISRSPQVKEIFTAPGNAGTGVIGTNVPIPANDIDRLAAFAREQKIDLTVVGPEEPLAAGLVDLLRKSGRPAFGPTREAARMETKVFSKGFLTRHKIPTADFQTAESLTQATEILRRWGGKPAVIKADGLAAGKGVLICDSPAEKEAALKLIFIDKTFGSAGNRVVIEEKLAGEEVSCLIVADGRNYRSFVSAQDHKKAGENDTGPNTGGMGVIAPNPFLDAKLQREITGRIIEPTLAGLEQEGIFYQGILYAGVMLTGNGPQVLEFNVRFGDPETQAIVPLLQSDLFELLWNAGRGELDRAACDFRAGAACTVVLASGGYPGDYQKGREITGLDTLAGREDLLVFHAGTSKENNKFLTNGGRVLGVTGLGDDLETAVAKAYAGIEQIHFEGAYFRRDIGRRALEHIRNP